MNNNKDIMQTRRRKIADINDDDSGAGGDTLANGDFANEDVTPKTFPYVWTFSLMFSCLFFTVVLMPLLALNIPRAPRDDLPWWQKAAIHRIKTREFHSLNADGVGDIKGIVATADHLQWLGVAAVLLDPIFTSSGDDIPGVTNFFEVDAKLGTLADVKSMINTFHDKGDSKYKDYYVWSEGKRSSDGTLQPPNNWLSVSGGSAWSYDDTRQQYFLHQFHHSLPDFNFYNTDVVEEIKNIMRFWLEVGVDGFHVSHVDYLVESQDVTLNEPRSCNHDALLTDYNYLLHPYTHQVSFVHNLTKQWKDVLDEFQSPTTPLLLLLDSWPSVESEDFNTWNQHNQGKSQMAINYVLSQTLKNKVPCGGNCLGRQIYEVSNLGVVDALFTWTVLQNRATSQDAGDYADVYNILALLLPGTPLTHAGQETGKCRLETYNAIKESKACQPSVNLFKRILDLRQEPAFLWGRLEEAVRNENIYSYFRYAKGWSYTKYLVAVNVGSSVSNDSYINSSPLVKCPEKATVVALTPSHSKRSSHLRPGDKVSLNDLKLYPGEGVVISLK